MTLEFKHQSKVYKAVNSQEDGFIKIDLPDESLHRVFPNGRTASNLQQGPQINASCLSPEQNLLLSILSAAEATYSRMEDKARQHG